MSKNVAVFVDVANIFYAAKAAGVDIDYITLLKAATAGRDFVRAYAYTGLDPENDNQRQFHAFLARNGYKVISKDIRKYGDGRIKANLDIELVVDMMKTARNLDIAVVVSGDGDFASAIRAVQEMGVRVEVISFRGNTSSDLIDVADLFTDIAQIARVDKSGRSGRRVAAEGDLSMTEVPEKETEGAPRRRRTTRTTRDETPPVVVAEADERASSPVAMPGERLSRAPETELDADLEAEMEEDAMLAGASENGVEPGSEDARRRRRRRGGRGRGRGRRPEDEGLAGTTEGSEVSEPSAGAEPSTSEEDEEYEELPSAQPPVHSFGSVWDSQIGVPTAASMPPTVDLSGGAMADDDDYAEPEVPEYLLAERRQSGQRSQTGNRGRTGGGGRNRTAYQAALDRERYGSSRPAQPSYGSSSPGGGNRSQGGGNRDRNRQSRPPQGNRQQDRAPRAPDRQYVDQRSSNEPWSEVPPELEEMLRAEMARKQPVAEDATYRRAPSPTPPVEATVEFDAVAQVEPAPAESARAKPARKPRTTAAKPASTAKPRAAAKSKASTATSATEALEAATPATSTTRSRSTKSTTSAKASAAGTAGPAETAPAAAPKKPVRKRATTKSAPAAEEG